jgi:hypothetical protein
MTCHLSKMLRQGYILHADYNGATLANISLSHYAKTYTLLEAHGFNQWAYLVLPSEFTETTKNTYSSYVKTLTFLHSGTQVTMKIHVNYVYASDSAGGFRVAPRAFEITFSHVTTDLPT